MDTALAIKVKTQGWIASKAGKMKESHPDDLINAWESGVYRGLNLKDKIVKDYFDDKVNKALQAASELFESFNVKVKMKCSEAFFKIVDIKDFDFLYLVDFDDYLSNRRLKAYEMALNTKRLCKENDDLGFNFTIKPITQHTKVENVFADGYVLRYAPESRKSQS